MKITFGIITDATTLNNLESVIDSIINLKIPEFEIIIVGNLDMPQNERVKILPFNENIKKGWITRKKNLITQNANFEFIVYSHDYYVFDKEWYSQVLAFGGDFDVCMHQIKNLDGTRYHDWTLWVENQSLMDKYLERSRAALIPYESNEFVKYMYIPGGYWMAKKVFMEKHPLNEELVWGQAEDVEWSKRIRENLNYKMNSKAIVSILKLKEPKFKIPNFFQMQIIKLIRFFDNLL